MKRKQRNLYAYSLEQTIQRMRERYGIELDEANYKDLCLKFKDPSNYQLVAHEASDHQIIGIIDWHIDADLVPITVVYNTEEGLIKTVLPDL